MPICPLLSKSGEEPSDCLKQQCAWYLPTRKGYCAIVIIAFFIAAPKVEAVE
jgi:hypothetical protein